MIDQVSALAIADKAMRAKFGNLVIDRQMPFVAELNNGVWHIYGTLPDGNTLGGTAEVEISEADGKVLKVWHGR